MPVRSVLVPLTSAQPLALSALMHGVTVDPIERTATGVYVDLIGAEGKIDSTLRNVEGVEYLDTVDKVMHMEPTFTMIGRTMQ